MPAKLRNQIGDTLVITNMKDKGLCCLNIYNLSEWKKRLDKLDAVPPQKRRKFLLALEPVEIKLCKQGRFIIPQRHCNHAEIENKITIVALEKYLEVWSTENWERVLSLPEGGFYCFDGFF